MSMINKEISDFTAMAFHNGEFKTIDKKSMYNDTDVDYKNGDIVNHDTYGKGVVVAVDKSIITIAFSASIGIKKLMKNHKSIKKVATY